MYFVCLVCVCVFLISNEKFVILLKEREKERNKKKREGQSGGPVRKKKFGFVHRPNDFQLIYKKNHLVTLIEN